jgi:hypothetical protein
LIPVCLQGPKGSPVLRIENRIESAITGLTGFAKYLSDLNPRLALRTEIQEKGIGFLGPGRVVPLLG